MVTITRECASCHGTFTRDVKPNRVATAKYCCWECSGHGNIVHGHKANLERGDKSGYYREREGVREHRLVMEQILGRKLLHNEVVHHKDHNKRNNDPSNLEVKTKSEHASLHAKRADPIPLVCAYCGDEFEASAFQRRFYNKGQRIFYCSQFCGGSKNKGNKRR
jgi:hypothetical protein